jgi:hypothetical protein
MAALILLAIMGGCAALLYLKGTLGRGLLMVLNIIIAGFFALGFCELVGGLLGKYVSAVAPFANTIAFLLIEIIVFAGLQTAVIQLDQAKMDLGQWAEKIGRPICGLILGFIVTGQLFVAASMAPLPNQYPYPRFASRNPNPSQPSKPLLDPDGFVTGLFGTISKGGFAALSEPKSFAMLHAGFLDHLRLNRLMLSEKLQLNSTSKPGFRIPSGGVREAPNTIRDSEGNALSGRPGERLILVTMEINRAGLDKEAKFALSQVRLVCRDAASTSRPLAGKGLAVYPVGHVESNGRLTQESLSTILTVEGDTRSPRPIELAFYVPSGYTPTLVGFLGNNLDQVSLARPQASSNGDGEGDSQGSEAD